jgi:hypothetical protein
MYWEAINPSTSFCSCGVFGCPYLVDLYAKINKKHITRPLYEVWRIIDSLYWPHKPFSPGSITQERGSIDPSLFGYWLSRCPRSLRELADVFREFSPKSIFLDNTKLFHIGELLSRFSQWGIIVLLRDPRGIMSSYKNAGIRKKDFRGATSVIPFLVDFIASVTRIMKNPNVIVLRYEDLCLNPSSALRRAVDFIGIPFEMGMLQPINSHPQSRGHILKGNRLLFGSAPVFLKEDLSWKDNLDTTELKHLYSKKQILDFYAQFGYSDLYESGYR